MRIRKEKEAGTKKNEGFKKGGRPNWGLICVGADAALKSRGIKRKCKKVFDPKNNLEGLEKGEGLKKKKGSGEA